MYTSNYIQDCNGQNIIQQAGSYTSKLDINVRNKLAKCYIWSTALLGAESWTLRTVGRKYLGSFEMWYWRSMEKISWTDHIINV